MSNLDPANENLKQKARELQNGKKGDLNTMSEVLSLVALTVMADKAKGQISPLQCKKSRDEILEKIEENNGTRWDWVVSYVITLVAFFGFLYKVLS